MMDIVGHVDATFGGKPVRFELYRDADTLARLEAAVGSANAAWGRFLLGNWTVSDLRAVLSLAHPAVPEPRTIAPQLSDLTPRVPRYAAAAKLADLMHRLSSPESAAPVRSPPPVALPRPAVRIRRGVPAEVIDAVAGRRPVATYALLAEKILQALIVGLPAAVATFDERTALDAARAAQSAPAEPSEAAA